MSEDTNEVPKGQRFTLVYAERGKPTQDSVRMRHRLASVIDDTAAFNSANVGRLSQLAEKELGIGGPWSSSRPWRHFLEQWDLKDVLDLVTVGYRLALEYDRTFRYGDDVKYAQRWVAEVRRIFREENVHYTVDDVGGVHFKFDEQFAKDRASAIASLQGHRFANARQAFEGAMEAFSKAPPDGKYAIRGIFSATENVFKLITLKDRLGAKEADELCPLIDRLFANDSSARHSARKMLSSFKDWVDAAHFYRHEPATEEVAQPPLSLAVFLVSAGASHLRWVADLDRAARGA